MTFSIIIPFYNEEKYIEQCALTLLHQTFSKKEYELIFVNNGSTDLSLEKIKPFRSRIQILEEPRQNVYTARNTALKHATGKHIVFTDADCTPSADWLRSIYTDFKNRNADVMLGKRIFAYNSSHILQIFEDYENAKIQYFLNSQNKKYYYAYTNNMAVKRSVFEIIGSFNDSVPMADTEFLQRYLHSHPSPKVIYNPNMLVRHLEIENTLCWLKKLWRYGTNNTSIEGRHGYKAQPILHQLKTFLYLVKEYRYGFLKSVRTLLLLLLGDLVYQTSRNKTLLSA